MKAVFETLGLPVSKRSKIGDSRMREIVGITGTALGAVTKVF